MAKAQLRHIAVSVPNKEETARFYEDTFGFKRVSESEVATRLTDGVMNLTFLQFRNQDDAGDERGKDFVGLHHFGLWVDNIDGAKQENRSQRWKISSGPERNASSECRTQVSGSQWHRVRYLHSWVGWGEALGACAN